MAACTPARARRAALVARKDQPRPREQRPGPGPRQTGRQKACWLPRRAGQQTRKREGRGRRAHRWVVVGWAPCRRRQGMCVGSAAAGATASESPVSCGPSKTSWHRASRCLLPFKSSSFGGAAERCCPRPRLASNARVGPCDSVHCYIGPAARSEPGSGLVRAGTGGQIQSRPRLIRLDGRTSTFRLAS